MKELIFGRAAGLRELMEKSGADAFVVVNDEKSNWESLYYLSGFRGTSGAFVLYMDDAELILDGRYARQGGEQSPFRVIDQKDGMTADIKASLARRGAKAIRCEAAKTSHSAWAALTEYGGEWLDGTLSLIHI